jgi:basic amino acid/polyamine antiporter, APA family
MATQTGRLSGSAASGAAGGAAFVRKSSGLLKTGTPWRIFVMSCTDQGVGAFMATLFLYGIGAFPRSNMMLALALDTFGILCFNLVYCLLAAAYPRSGGEYVFLSRILHPAIGFIGNVGAFVAFCFFSATGGFLVFTLAFAPAMEVLGVITHHPWITSVGDWTGTTHHAWLLAGILVVLYGVMCAFGMKVYYRYQGITWWAGIGCFLVLLVVYGTASHHTFINGFNHYMLVTAHQHDGYSKLLATAKHAGLPSGYTFHDTIGMFAAATSVAAAGAYMGGEVRTPLKTQTLGGAGGGLFYMVVVLLIGLMITHTTGTEFNKAATFLNVQNGSLYAPAQAPAFTFYAYLCTSSPVLLILMMLGTVIFSLILVPQQIIYPTRMLFAWSFDRLIPSKVASVSARTNSPIIATIIVVIFCEILLALYGSGQITFINPILIIGPVWATIAVAGLVIPFMPRSRAAFRNSRINVRVAGIPVITLLAVIACTFWTFSLYIAFTSDTLGANQASNERIAAAIFLAAAIYYVGARIVRSREGMNLDATFAELPPD